MSAARNLKHRKPIALAALLLAIGASLVLLNQEFHFVREPFGSYYGFENQRRLEEEHRVKIGLPIGVERWPNRENQQLKPCAPDRLYEEAESLQSKGRFSEAEKIYKRLVAVEFDIYRGCQKRVPGVLRQYLLLLKSAERTKEAQILEALLNSGNGLSKADLAAYMVDPPNETDFVIHPILHSKAGHNLENMHLHDDVFRQLNGCLFPLSLMLSTEREYFELAETAAAEQFVARVKDLSKGQILSMVGKPVFSGGTVDCWTISKVDEDIWLYRLGYLQIPVRLIFKADKCINSALCSSAEDREFADWRAAEIAKFSIGKSIDLIVEKFGVPSGDRYLAEKKLASSASKCYGTIGYITGLSTAVDLKIRRGICTDASIGMIAH